MDSFKRNCSADLLLDDTEQEQADLTPVDTAPRQKPALVVGFWKTSQPKPFQQKPASVRGFWDNPQPQPRDLTEGDREYYSIEPETSKKGESISFPAGKYVKDDDISDRAKQALRILSEEFGTVSRDEGKTKALAMATVSTLCEHFKAATHALLVTTLQQVKEILGRPSGASPPVATDPHAPQPETANGPPSPPLPTALPDSPPKWWRERNEKDTVPKWVETYYKPYLDAKLPLTRGFFQRKGQDKTFYNAILEWEKEPRDDKPGSPKNNLSDLGIPTKSEVLDRQREEMKSKPRFYVSTPETREAHRQYKANHRLGWNSSRNPP